MVAISVQLEFKHHLYKETQFESLLTPMLPLNNKLTLLPLVLHVGVTNQPSLLQFRIPLLAYLSIAVTPLSPYMVTNCPYMVTPPAIPLHLITQHQRQTLLIP